MMTSTVDLDEIERALQAGLEAVRILRGAAPTEAPARDGDDELIALAVVARVHMRQTKEAVRQAMLRLDIGVKQNGVWFIRRSDIPVLQASKKSRSS